MDQKNTIVKCKAHPNCLFNHNGVCDNYVINIGADGKCECYVETEILDTINELGMVYMATPEEIGTSIKKVSELIDIQRGQRANCDFINDGVDQEIVNEVCKPFTMFEHLCDTRCIYWQLDSYSEWVCSCMAEDINPHGYCPHYDDGGEDEV